MKNNIWMDIEIREDIDDILTLAYAIENNYDVRYISIHNPSIKELSVLENVLKKLKYRKAKLIISGKITKYSEDRDIHRSLSKYVENTINTDNFNNLDTYLNENKISTDLTFFCGGSLYTLSKVMEENQYISAYIQGGYAGSNIIDPSVALKKFRNRESVPTWNLNLDIESSDYVLKNHKNKIYFISKNICHKSEISIEKLNKENSFFESILYEYYSSNESKHRNKPIHDLLAFLALNNDSSSLIEFKEVLLSHTNDDRPKWKSELMENTDIYISVDFDYDLFLKIALNQI
jgi:inosine-uridine nucleoside N-ribohydrolase